MEDEEGGRQGKRCRRDRAQGAENGKAKGAENGKGKAKGAENGKGKAKGGPGVPVAGVHQVGGSLLIQWTTASYPRVRCNWARQREGHE